ncbi:rod shape-determining protein MreC [bacterium]|nr:rod shape-determining protein MreC [bacterium]
MFRKRNILILFIAALVIIFCARVGWLGSFSRSLTLDVSGFFVRIVNYPGQKLNYFWNLYQFRSAVLRENNALKLQLEALQRKYDQTRDLQARVHELEQMLNLQRDYDFELLPAPVVFRDEFSWSKTIIISRGRRDGLLPSMPVVRGGVLIGKIVEAGFLNSKVLLINDPTFKVGVLLRPSEAAGILEGRGEGLARINFLPLDAKINIGDEVYTSGTGSVFPAGYHIGSVIRVERDERNFYQRAEVQLAADMRSMETVTVIKHAPPNLSLSPEPEEEK